MTDDNSLSRIVALSLTHVPPETILVQSEARYVQNAPAFTVLGGCDVLVEQLLSILSVLDQQIGVPMGFQRLEEAGCQDCGHEFGERRRRSDGDEA